MKEKIELRHISYFENGNIFHGSCEGMRFRLAPEEEALKGYLWHGDLCFDLCQPEETATFPLSQEGLDLAVAWLEQHV